MGAVVLAIHQGFFLTTGKPTPLGSVKRGSLIQRVTVAGKVIAYRKTIIAAPYNGYVKKLFVKIGDKINQGDPIVSISQSLQSSETIFPLRAPFPGTVVQVEKTEGEYIREGDPKEFVVRIDDLAKLFIAANIPEMDRGKVHAGQEAIIRASAVLTRTYKGVIRELSLAAREVSFGTSQVEFPMRLEILNSDHQLNPGMSVIMDIVTSKKENILTLRHEFIRKENDAYFVIMKSGKKQPIAVGVSNEEVSEIREGIKEGDQVQQIDFLNLIKLQDD